MILQALPLHDNGKIVLHEHEPKDHEQDEPTKWGSLFDSACAVMDEALAVPA